MLDSMMNIKWTRFIGDTNDLHLTQHPYTIVATNDGGCLVFARKQARLFNDPYFIYPAPEWDIVVYKLNDKGDVMLSTPLIERPISFTIFPNPTSDFFTISNDIPYLKGMIVDVMGMKQLVFGESVGKIDVSSLPVGLYFVYLEDADNKRYITKFIKQ